MSGNLTGLCLYIHKGLINTRSTAYTVAGSNIKKQKLKYLPKFAFALALACLKGYRGFAKIVKLQHKLFGAH